MKNFDHQLMQIANLDLGHSWPIIGSIFKREQMQDDKNQYQKALSPQTLLHPACGLPAAGGKRIA